MKRIIFFCFISACILFSSCKKSSKTTATTTPNASPQPYGELTASKVFTYNSSTGTLSAPINNGYADFRTDIQSISSVIQVGGVWANGTKFKFQPASTTYADTTNILTMNPTTWQVTGAGSIPSFTYTNNDNLPAYTGYISLPDTIYKNQNLSLQVNGVSGADEIEVSFYNNTIPSANIYQSKSGGVLTNNTFSFSSSSLSVLPTGPSSPTTLIVSVFKNNPQVISNVNFRFVSQLEINKQVYIK
jgi:hypothetical protein